MSFALITDSPPFPLSLERGGSEKIKILYKTIMGVSKKKNPIYN